MSESRVRAAIGAAEVERDVPMLMRDGTTLRADVYRPPHEEDLPVLLMRTPYDKVLAQNIVYQHPAWYAAHGYVVVVNDVRGRFASGGDFDPLRSEAADGCDAIEWAARLPGTTGQVGTYGFSYAGATQMLAASTSPKGLACMVPAMTACDYYDGWFYRGGAFQLALVVSWFLEFLAGPDLARRKELAAARRLADELRRHGAAALLGDQPLRDHPLLREAGIDYFFDWLEHDRRDAYWREIGLPERLDTIDVPCLHIAGWYDSFVEGSLRLFDGLARRAGQSDRQQLIVGPWMHIPWNRKVGMRDFGPGAANGIDEIQLRWFDRWLKGAPAVAEDEPAVRYFAMGANEWQSAASWPPPDVEIQRWYLHSSGRALSSSGDGALRRESPVADELPDVFTYVPSTPVPSAGGRSCCNADSVPMGPACQCGVESRNDVLVYTTPVLTEPLTIVGRTELVLYASTDCVDTDWTAKLVHVDLDGHAVNLCGGIIRARFRDSLEEPQLLEPHEIVEYRIEVGSTALKLMPGEALRLEVASSEYPTYDANPNTGVRVADADVASAVTATQAVFHDELRPSHVLLPVSTSTTTTTQGTMHE